MLDRRTLLVSTSALVVSGCVTCDLPGPRTIVRPVGDAHAHFFNASDLPVGGFIKNVFLPMVLEDAPQVVLALVDIASWLAKKLALSATAELARIGDGQLLGPDELEAPKFAEELAELQEMRIGDDAANLLATGDPVTDLAASHLYLALVLGAVEDPAALQARTRQRISIDEEVYERIAVNGSEAVTSGQTEALAANPEFAAPTMVDLAEVKSTIAWVFLMCQSRCSHVAEYKRVIASGDYAVRDAVNLLVDYDQWLGDEPETRSSHAKQVEFWTAWSDKTIGTEGALRLHTFAGFDPLREAEEQLASPGESTTLDRMLDWAREGHDSSSTASHRIAGFKLYPPMGFRPDENSETRLPYERAGRVVRDRWDRRWDFSEIRTRLDSALDRFFRRCSQADIPILAHASQSMEAMPGADGNAMPYHWLARARMVNGYGDGHSPLRACLGHFHMGGLNTLVLRQALQMNADCEANLYFDISFDYDILNDNASALLNALARECDGNGGEKYIMFGSDWIMLGREAQANSFLGRLIDAASEHSFWGQHIDRLLRQNLLDFLGPAAPPQDT